MPVETRGGKIMTFENERKEMIAYGKKLVDEQLTSGTGGNISVYNPDTKEMAITPSGLDFYSMTEEDIVIVDLEGNIIEGKLKPSSEWAMHAIFYKERTDIQALIHAHTTYATVLSCLHEKLPASHYMVAAAGKDVRVAEYATFGSKELSLNSFEAMKDRKAVILANHGIIGGESSLKGAYNVIEQVEYCSKIHCIAKSIGNPVILSDEEMEKMSVEFSHYGQPHEI